MLFMNQSPSILEMMSKTHDVIQCKEKIGKHNPADTECSDYQARAERSDRETEGDGEEYRRGYTIRGECCSHEVGRKDDKDKKHQGEVRAKCLHLYVLRIGGAARLDQRRGIASCLNRGDVDGQRWMCLAGSTAFVRVDGCTEVTRDKNRRVSAV